MRTKKETTTESQVRRDPTGKFVTAQPNLGFYQAPNWPPVSYPYPGPFEALNANMFINQILEMKSKLETVIFYHKRDIKTCKKYINDDKRPFGTYINVNNIANELFDVRAWTMTSETDATAFVKMLEKELPELEILLEKINDMLDEMTSDPKPPADDKPGTDAPGMLGDTPIDSFGWSRLSKE